MTQGLKLVKFTEQPQTKTVRMIEEGQPWANPRAMAGFQFFSFHGFIYVFNPAGEMIGWLGSEERCLMEGMKPLACQLSGQIVRADGIFLEGAIKLTEGAYKHGTAILPGQGTFPAFRDDSSWANPVWVCQVPEGVAIQKVKPSQPSNSQQAQAGKPTRKGRKPAQKPQQAQQAWGQY